MEFRYFLKTAAMLLLLLFGGFTLNAQDPARILAAHRLFQTLNMPAQHQRILAILLDEHFRNNPQQLPYKEVIRQNLQQNLSWNSIRESMARLLARDFTVKEINEINAFYSTPTGRKVAAKFIELMYRAADIGKRRLQGQFNFM